MQQSVSNKVFTIPNLLSVIRLLLLPVFFVLLVLYESNIMAFLVLLVASLSDLVDGFIARATNTVTKLGQWLDPFVDRVFIIVGVIAIYLVGRVPLWILVLLLARDACMFVLTIYQKRKFNRDFKVIFIGKATTAFLMAGFCSLVLYWPVLPGANVFELSFLPGWGVASTPLGSWLLYFGSIFSVITAGIYLYRGTRPSKDDGLAKALLAQRSARASAANESSPDEFSPRSSASASSASRLFSSRSSASRSSASRSSSSRSSSSQASASRLFKSRSSVPSSSAPRSSAPSSSSLRTPSSLSPSTHASRPTTERSGSDKGFKGTREGKTR